MIQRATAYSWYVLSISFVVMVLCVGLQWSILPPLFLEISGKLGMSIPDLMVVWSMLPLGAVVFSLPAGIVGDKIGFRLSIGIGCLISGLFGALRGVSTSMSMLSSIMFMFGLGFSLLMVNMPKVLGYFFPPRLIGTAVGFTSGVGVCAGIGVAMTFGSRMSSAFGGWDNTMYYLGIFSIVLGVIWLLTIRVPELALPPGVAESKPPSLKEALTGLVCNKEVWVLNIAYFFIMGSYWAISGYLPTFFAGVLGARGYSPPAAMATAGAIVGMMPWGLAIGSLFWSPISDRVGVRKVFIVSAMLLAALFTILAFFIGPPGIWAIMTVWGICAGAAPLILVVPIEHPRIGPLIAGTAVGLIMLFGNVGGFIAGFVGGWLLGAFGSLGLFMWAVVLTALGGVMVIFVKETGPRTRRGT